MCRHVVRHWGWRHGRSFRAFLDAALLYIIFQTSGLYGRYTWAFNQYGLRMICRKMTTLKPFIVTSRLQAQPCSFPIFLFEYIYLTYNARSDTTGQVQHYLARSKRHVGTSCARRRTRYLELMPQTSDCQPKSFMSRITQSFEITFLRLTHQALETTATLSDLQGQRSQSLWHLTPFGLASFSQTALPREESANIC